MTNLPDLTIPPDVAYVGDLALIRPAYTTRIKEIKDRAEIDSTLMRNIEMLVNDSFRERGMKIVPDYFSLPLWDSFQYLLIIQDLMKDRDAGVLIAFKPDDFIVYDKIAVHPGYRGRHFMTKLISAARVIDKRMHGQIDAGARTSDKTVHEKYRRLSDYSVFVPGHDNKTNYWVHIFNGSNSNGIAPKREKSVSSLIEIPSTFESLG